MTTMTTDSTAGSVVVPAAHILKLDTGYVLQLTDGRNVAYESLVKLGKGIVRELGRKSRVAHSTSPAAPDDALLGQAYNLARLCDGLSRGELSAVDFNDGLARYCPDVRGQPWAQTAIGTALHAAVAVGSADSPAPREKPAAAKGEPAAPIPWQCGYCKRDSDCLFDVGEDSLELVGDAPCAKCQLCLDDECGGEREDQPMPEPADVPDDEVIPEGPEPDEEMPATEIRYLVDNKGQRVGQITVET